MEINIQEIFEKHSILVPVREALTPAIKEIITEVLKEAADSAYGEMYFTTDGERGVLVDKESITSTINKVKF